jgi:hypothetical protein
MPEAAVAALPEPAVPESTFALRLFAIMPASKAVFGSVPSILDYLAKYPATHSSETQR